MPVELRNAQRRIRVDLRRVRKVAEKLLKGLQREKMIVSVLLTDDREMAKLHERWMGDPSPTDVLSFPARTKVPFPGVPGSGKFKAVLPEMVPILGDIAISVETAARRLPGDPMKEIEGYLIHGVLHLAGHDHATAAEKKKMWAEARRLRRLINSHPKEK